MFPQWQKGQKLKRRSEMFHNKVDDLVKSQNYDGKEKSSQDQVE